VAVGSLLVPFGVGLMFVDKSNASLAAVLSNAALYLPVVVACLVLHELGHAVAGRALGMDIVRVVIGDGRRVGRFRIRGVPIHINALPLRGLVYAVPRSSTLARLRLVFFSLGGPTVNAVFVVLLFRYMEVSSYGLPTLHLAQAFDPLEVLWFANAFLLLSAVVLGSDLWPLLALPFAKSSSQDYQALRIAFQAMDAYDDCDYGRWREILAEGVRQLPDSWVLRADHASAQMRSRDYRGARRSLEAVLAHPKVVKAARYTILNNLAWAHVMDSDRYETLPASEKYSLEATESLSTPPPSHLGTRGAVLVLKGDQQRGQNLLQRAFDRNSAPQSRAHNAAWLSLVHTWQGHDDEARHYRALAIQLDAGCDSLSVIDALAAEGPRNHDMSKASGGGETGQDANGD